MTKGKYQEKKDRADMETVEIGGTEFKVDAELKAAYDKEFELFKKKKGKEDEDEDEDKMKAKSEDKKDSATEVSDSQARIDALEAKLDALPDQLLAGITKRDQAIAADATERQAIIHGAESVLPNSFKFDGKSNLEIQRAAIKAANETWVPLAKEDSAVPGLFAAATAGKQKKDSALSGARDDDRAPAVGMIEQARIDAATRLRLISDHPVAGTAATKAGDKGAA